ncbi:MAG: AMP-binding protein [Bacteroidales bacterium]
MKELKSTTFPAMLTATVEKYPDSVAFGFVGETPVTYREVAVQVSSLMAMLEDAGIEKNDKVAILSTNMPNWGITYFAITSMGAVAVPILPDFSPAEVANIISHSETKLIFASSALMPKTEQLPVTVSRVLLDDFSVVHAEKSFGFRQASVPAKKYEVAENDLAVIIYTSGTTGRSKGVMLSHLSICFDAYGGSLIQTIDQNDRFLSVLPLSHTYENTLGLILPVMHGSSVWYLRKPPTAPVLLPALQEVRPTIMLTVPLIIEKIYFNKVAPTFNAKPVTRALFNFAPTRKVLSKLAGKKLMKTFGGEMKFFGVGGAKINKTVERFLIEAKFPYAVGYGLTETAPLIAGFGPFKGAWESTGPAMNGVTLKINNPDPVTGEGEVWAKGINIMQGYYKEPEMTAEVLTEDGWFKTGDLATMDDKGFLFIKGRLKNMILTSTGENIYPEEIESVINNFRHVVESLVIEQKGKLVAMVHLNMEELESKYQAMKDEVARRKEDFINDVLRELQDYVNSQVGKGSRLAMVVLQPEPFQKTPTMKIKRFLYY